MNPSPAVRDLLLKGMNAGHRLILTVTGGRVGNTVVGVPTVELETTGRTSGKPRTVLLIAPIRTSDEVVLVASKGGDDRHPEWYRNLVANPHVWLTIDGERAAYTARTATPEEKAIMWPAAVAAYKGYASYQKRTSRDIPLVICTPVT